MLFPLDISTKPHMGKNSFAPLLPSHVHGKMIAPLAPPVPHSASPTGVGVLISRIQLSGSSLFLIDHGLQATSRWPASLISALFIWAGSLLLHKIFFLRVALVQHLRSCLVAFSAFRS